MAALAVAIVLALALAAQAGISDKLVSRSSQGTPANGDSETDVGGALSRDGRLVAFSSRADNLPRGDGSTSRVYVRDIAQGKTRLASTKGNGDPPDGDVGSAAISANGRFVVFYGFGNGLPGANGTDQQVWIHDRTSGKTRLVSKANNGDPGDNHSEYPSVSGNGRYVTFNSDSDNLPGGDGINQLTYLRDVREKKTVLVSKTNGGDPAYGAVFGQSISSDGRRVVYDSSDPDLPGGDGSTEHVYLRDLDAHHTRLVDRTSGGAVANGSGYYASISGNGRFVGFDSPATNLPAGDGSDRQAYLRDLKTGKTKLVSRNSQGDPQDADAYYPHPSGNGRYVAFEGNGSNLPHGDGSTVQIYVRDMREQKTLLLSRAANGDPADTAADYPTMSLDGRFAAFHSGADNLGGDTNYNNVFRAGPIG